MKFLITGDIRQSGGHRLLLTITLFFFLAFLAANATLLHLQTGLLPQQVAALQESSAAVRIERAHLQLFLFLMLHLFTSALLFRLGPPGNQRTGQGVAGPVTVLGAVLIMAYLGFALWPIPFAYSFSVIAVHAWFAALIAFLLAALHTVRAKPDEQVRREPPPQAHREGSETVQNPPRSRSPGSALVLLFAFAALQTVSGSVLFFTKAGWHAADVIEYYRGSETMLEHFPDRTDRFRSAPGLVGRLEVAFAHTFACSLLGFVVLHVVQARRLGPEYQRQRGRHHLMMRTVTVLFFASAGANVLVDVLLPITPWWFALFKLPSHIAFVGANLLLIATGVQAFMARPSVREATAGPAIGPNATGDDLTE